MLAVDAEGGAEVYSAATTKDEAKIVFDESCSMRDNSPALRKAIGKAQKQPAHRKSAGKFQPLSNEESTLRRSERPLRSGRPSFTHTPTALYGTFRLPQALVVRV